MKFNEGDILVFTKGRWEGYAFRLLHYRKVADYTQPDMQIETVLIRDSQIVSKRYCLPPAGYNRECEAFEDDMKLASEYVKQQFILQTLSII